jgi:anti-repressor protein
MSTDVLRFRYGSRDIRTVDIDGERWAVAADVCAVLELNNVSMALSRLDEADISTTDIRSGGQMRSVKVVSEDGATDLVLDSRKPEARRFRRWLTHEVWPSIRDTGSYGMPAEPPDRKTLAQWVIDAEERAELAELARGEAERHAQALEAPAAAWTQLADAAGDYEVADAAKVLSRDPNIDIGRDRLFKFMQSEGWIFRSRATRRWRACQTQIDCGRITEKLGAPYFHEPSGEMRIPEPTIRMTPKGIAELQKRLGGGGQRALVAAL